MLGSTDSLDSQRQTFRWSRGQRRLKLLRRFVGRCGVERACISISDLNEGIVWNEILGNGIWPLVEFENHSDSGKFPEERIVYVIPRM